MELRHLRYFVAVAERLSFTRAAHALHVSQPPLSAAVRQLEDELGVELLLRNRRRVELTPAGSAFLREARLTLEQADRTGRVAREAARGLAGSLHIGYTPSADLSILPIFLRLLHENAPGLEPCLRMMPADLQAGALRDEIISLGFLRLPLTGGTRPPVVARRLFDEQLVLAIPEKHPLARRRAVAMRQLEGEPLVLFPRHMAPASYDELIMHARREGFLLRIAHEVEMLQTALGLAAAGLGIAAVPAAATLLGRRGVLYRPFAPPVPTLEMGVAHCVPARDPRLLASLELVDRAAREYLETARRNRP